MKTTPITQLKASLSKFLALVKGGSEVVITEHGVPIARIVPMRASKGGNAEYQARRLRLARQGMLTLGAGTLDLEALGEPVVTESDVSVVRALLDERNESW